METKKYDRDKIVNAIKERGLTAYSLSKKLPLTEFGINKIITGESKSPRKSTLQILHNYLFSNTTYNNEVEDLEVKEPYELQYTENKNSNSFMLLPSGQYLMTMPLAEFKIQAGFLDHYQDIEYLNGLSQHSIIVDKPLKGRYVAFRVKGDSMDNGTSDAILHNYIVTTRELQRQHWNSPLRYNDFRFWVIYTTQSAYPLLKEITGHDVEKGVIKCHSLNDAPEYTDFELSLNDVQALFYVVDVNRNMSQKDYF